MAPSPAASPSSVTFGSAVVVDPIHTFGEPDIRISGNDVYVSGPWGTGTQRSLWEWSRDGGNTFRTLHSTPVSSSNESATTIFGPGGGDTELSIDHTGKVYYADLAALATLKVATWDPRTRTMKTGVFAGAETVNGYDRQWFALWDPANPAAVRKATGYTGPFPVNYLTYTEALAGSDCSPIQAAKSTACDGAKFSTDGINYGSVTSFFTKANDGNIVIDQNTGTVLQALSVSGSDDVGVAIRTRDPSTPSSPALTKFKLVKAAKFPKGITTGGPVPFPVIGLDQDRNAYLVWGTRGKPSDADPQAWQVFYSYSTAKTGWAQWSKPVMLSSPPSRTATMPWVVAGGRGRFAAVWYGTPDGKDDPSAGDAHQPWDVYLAMVSGADSAHPHIEQTKVTRHPMHYGTICMLGTLCIEQQGNRNLADFFQVTADPTTGAVAIVYDDTSNELIQTIPGTSTPIPPPVDGIFDHRGAPVVTVLRQNGGIGLFGKPIAGAAALGSARISGIAGNAMFDPVYGGAEVKALDTRGLTISANGDELVFRLAISSLKDTAGALSTTGARALDYVIRWVGEPIDTPPTGTRNPIYYAAAEVTQSGSPTFFAGAAQSVDLCSVSGCFPHTITYPAPPLGGTAVTGTLVSGAGAGPDFWEIHVPRNVVGGPTNDSLFESLSAFTMARNKPASLPTTNVEEELGISPIVVDALCCVDSTLATKSPVVLGTKTIRPAPKPASRSGGRLAATGVRSAPVWIVLALIGAAVLVRRTLRRT